MWHILIKAYEHKENILRHEYDEIQDLNTMHYSCTVSYSGPFFPLSIMRINMRFAWRSIGQVLFLDANATVLIGTPGNDFVP